MFQCHTTYILLIEAQYTGAHKSHTIKTKCDVVNNQSAICDIQEFDVCFNIFLGSIFLDLHTNTQKQKRKYR